MPGASAAEWAFELLRPSDPNIARQLDEMCTAVWGPSPLEVLDSWGDRASREGRSIADPIADVRAFLDDQRHEIDRINRSKP